MRQTTKDVKNTSIVTDMDTKNKLKEETVNSDSMDKIKWLYDTKEMLGDRVKRV